MPQATPGVPPRWAAVPLLTGAQAGAGDRAAVAAGDTWSGLMGRAAGHLARVTLATAGRGYGLRVAVLVGKGDNGGDGWAAAPLLARAGARVRVVAVDGVEVEVSQACGRYRQAWRDAGGTVEVGVDGLDATLRWADVAVDALLGTGARGAPRGPAAAAVAALDAAASAGLPVVACDVPSGVDADTGQVAGRAVRATTTVTFGAPKRGLRLHPGSVHAGDVVVGGLGDRWPLPRPHRDADGGLTGLGGRRGATGQAPSDGPQAASWWELTATGAAPRPLPPHADKRARGVLRVLAGAVGTSGAAALTATAAVRAGAGLVTCVTPEPVRAEVACRTDAGAMVVGAPVGDGEAAGQLAGPDAAPLDGIDAVVAGPGLGHGPGVAAAVADLRARAARLVLDADALNVHRDEPDALADHAGALVLTPHERELARIGAGQDGPDGWAHRVERVPELAVRYDATIVAKGPGTLVAAPDGRVWVCPHGGPGLGSGGTGDVLAGVIGAAVAAEPDEADGGDVPAAVARAVWWHAVAGDRAGARAGDRSSATDLLAELPGVLGDLTALAAGGSHRPAPPHRGGDVDELAGLGMGWRP